MAKSVRNTGPITHAIHVCISIVLVLLAWPHTRCTAQTISIPSLPFNNVQDIDTLISSVGDARIVLLGEASHGTSDYYLWRTAITQRLINEKGFNIIAVEGEWADCYRVNKFVKGAMQDSMAAVTLLQGFNRWPAWMWANNETVQLVRWLNEDNQHKDVVRKTGFYGLDLYCIRESINELEQNKASFDTIVGKAIQNTWNCFESYGPDAMDYARGLIKHEKACGNEAGHLWGLMKNYYKGPRTDDEFANEQYALVAEDGERYFRNISSGASAWNLRENHMYTTVKRLLANGGLGARIIIWAHNTHAGDARSTTLPVRHKINLGQLLREAYGDSQVYIIGLGSYTGTVLCGNNWGDTMRRIALPPARPGSWEDILHTQYHGNRIILCRTLGNIPALNSYFYTRAVGAIYRPAEDAYSSYTASIMSHRYDAFLFLDKTAALHPLPVTSNKGQVSDWLLIDDYLFI